MPGSRTSIRDLPTVAGVPLTGLPRATYRKFVYRKETLRRYGMRCGDSLAPSKRLELDIEFLGPDRYDVVFGTNPHMDMSDKEHFDSQESICIVAWDGERIASSSWMTKGKVYIHELQRTICVPSDEHLSCRSFVDPDYRGLALMSHMIHTYSRAQPPDDRVWGFVLAWNTESIRSLERIGWRHYGEDWTRFVLGRKFGGHTEFDPRPPSTIDQ